MLTVLTAGLLASCLAGAWFQVRGSRELGPAVRIGESPMFARPPVGWKADPRDPSTFILWLDEAVTGANVPRRSVSFGYDANDDGLSPTAYLRRMLRGSDVTDKGEAKIAGFAGAQVLQRELLRFRRARPYEIESILRVAMTPSGEILLVRYTPFSAFTPADADLLESICAAVRVVDLRGVDIRY